MTTRRRKIPVPVGPMFQHGPMNMDQQDKALLLLIIACRDFMAKQSRYTYASLVRAVDLGEQRQLDLYFTKHPRRKRQ